MEKTKILQLIKEYTSVTDLASENATKLLNGTMTNDEAARRMKFLSEIEEKLFVEEICKSTNAPLVLTNHYSAIKDTACMSCWVSSSRSVRHKNCQVKISFYFETREALRNFGKTLEEIK